MGSSKEDLDAFLTIVESKLRGPFSSLDLAKAATNSSMSPSAYLQQLSEVMARMDKVTKLRVLAGLMGLNPSTETDNKIYEILSEAEEYRLSEEWVRVVAGLIRGIMFRDGDGSRESCRGEEAQRLLDKTCIDVIEKVRETKGSGGGSECDMEPLFAPYYYSLLDPETLRVVAPSCLSHPHFQVNRDASVLKEDEVAELKREKDAIQHKRSTFRPPSASSKAANTASNARHLPTMPGMRALNKTKAKPTAGKTSMFMPSKKPSATAASGVSVCSKVLPRTDFLLTMLAADNEKKNCAAQTTSGSGTSTVVPGSAAASNQNRTTCGSGRWKERSQIRCKQI